MIHSHPTITCPKCHGIGEIPHVGWDLEFEGNPQRIECPECEGACVVRQECIICDELAVISYDGRGFCGPAHMLENYEGSDDYFGLAIAHRWKRERPVLELRRAVEVLQEVTGQIRAENWRASA